jgi:hypothetical protein
MEGVCRSGGVQGGLSNGENIVIKVAFKPTSTIAKKQNTVSRDGEDVDLVARGRHDPCVVPRAVPMVEAMVALVLVDQLLQVRNLTSNYAFVMDGPPALPASSVYICGRCLHCPLSYHEHLGMELGGGGGASAHVVIFHLMRFSVKGTERMGRGGGG